MAGAGAAASDPKRVVHGNVRQPVGLEDMPSGPCLSSGLCEDAMRQRLAWVPIASNLTASRVLFGQNVGTVGPEEGLAHREPRMLGGLTDAQFVGVFEAATDSSPCKDTGALELFLAACDAVGEGDANIFLLQAVNASGVALELLSTLPGNAAVRSLPPIPEPPFLLVTNSFESRSAVTLPLALSSTASAPDEWDAAEDGEWQACFFFLQRSVLTD